MTDLEAMVTDLEAHLALCRELFQLAERECRSLLTASEAGSSALEFSRLREGVLSRLDESLARLRKRRVEWRCLPPQERQRFPGVSSLLRANQDLILKILILDRENEQARLRHGLMPASHLPPAARQRPHFVADLYQRNSR